MIIIYILYEKLQKFKATRKISICFKIFILICSWSSGSFLTFLQCQNYNFIIFKISKQHQMRNELQFDPTCPQVLHSLQKLMESVFSNFLECLKQNELIHYEKIINDQGPQLLRTIDINLPFGSLIIKLAAIFSVKMLLIIPRMSLGLHFKISQIGGLELRQHCNRTRMEILHATKALNIHFGNINSQFRVSSDHRDSLIFSLQDNQINFENIQGFNFESIYDANRHGLDELITIAKCINEPDFLTVSYVNSDDADIFQILKIFLTEPIHILATNTLKDCFQPYLQKAKLINQGIESLRQSNQQKYLLLQRYDLMEQRQSEEVIADSIYIKSILKPSRDQEAYFIQNAYRNEVSLLDSITLNQVQFYRMGSLNAVRANKTPDQPFDYDKHEIGLKKEHLIFKVVPKHKPITSPKQQQDRLKCLFGIENEHYFVTKLGSKTCPYINRFYLDYEQKLMNIEDRTIMNVFMRGDLSNQIFFNLVNQGTVNKENNTIDCFLKIFQQLALAVKFLHQNKVIHRDIKPLNVCIQFYEAQKDFICKLIDFGSSLFLDDPNTPHKQLITTKSFNLTYQNAKKQTESEIQQDFDKDGFQTHELFDIYAIAQTVDILYQKSIFSGQIEQLQLIFDICQHPNPGQRLFPQEIIVLIRHLRLLHAKDLNPDEDDEEIKKNKTKKIIRHGFKRRREHPN